MSNSLRLAILLLAGALFTLIWMGVCPKYTLGGSVTSYEMVSDFSSNGQRSQSFNHTEPSMFFGGEIVIWSVLAGAYLLIPQLLSLVGPISNEIKKEIKAEST